MLPYHTRFGPDWCYGLVKMKYKHSYISSVSQLVYVRQYPSPQEVKINVVKDQSKVQELLTTEPEVIPPPGLSAERSWYLYENVRQYCEGDNNKDITCPKPSVPKAHSCKSDQQ